MAFDNMKKEKKFPLRKRFHPVPAPQTRYLVTIIQNSRNFYYESHSVTKLKSIILIYVDLFMLIKHSYQDCPKSIVSCEAVLYI